MSSRDFLAKRIRTNAIISAGDAQSSPSLLVYPETSAIDSTGAYKLGMLDNVGSDVISFFSGSAGSMVYTDEEGILQPSNGERGVSLFSGDIHVSGALFVGGSVISNNQALGAENLKGYAELGDFTLTQEVLGNNSIAIGNYLTASSDNTIVIGYSNTAKPGDTTELTNENIPDINKFIIGGKDNTLISPRSYIYGGFQNLISGSGEDNLVLGGFSNNIDSDSSSGDVIFSRRSSILNTINSTISGSLQSSIISSNNVTIKEGADKNIVLNGEGINIAGPVNSNIFVGKNLEASSEQDAFSSFNFIFSNNTQLKTSSKNIVFGLNNDSQYDSTTDPRGYLSLTGSNESFIIGKKNLHINNSKENFIFSGNSARKNDDVNLENTSISNLTGSFIFGDNIQINGSRDSFIGSSNDIKTEDDLDRSLILNFEGTPVRTSPDDYSITKPTQEQVDKFNYFKREGLSIGDADYIFSQNTGFNSLISTKDSRIRYGMFSTIVGGFFNEVTGIGNSVFGGFKNNIGSHSSGSYIFGGHKNRIGPGIDSINGSTNRSFILGNRNYIASCESFVIGDDNEISFRSFPDKINNSFILGRSNLVRSKNTFIIGHNLEEKNTDNRIIIGHGKDSNTSYLPRDTSLIISSSYLVFGDLEKDGIESQYGTEVNFFVSGSVGAKESHNLDRTAGHYGVAVFGGDVHISGTLSGGNFGIEELFKDGGDAKDRDRTLGNRDAKKLSFLTDNKKRMTIDKNGAICIGEGSGNYSLLHVRTGSGQSEFNSSEDGQPANHYPFVISKDQNNVSIVEHEVGLAFQVFPEDLNSDDCNKNLNEEPGSAITHYTDEQVQGDISSYGASKGGLRFKTKTTNSQFTLDGSTSLSTKLTLTSEGYFLLGKGDNPNNQVIDLRSYNSNHTLIQASGDSLDNRTIFLMDHDTPDLQIDTNFYVRGIVGSKSEKGETENNDNKRGTAVFGGDVAISGSIYVDENIRVTKDIIARDKSLNIIVPQDENNQQGILNLNASGNNSKIEIKTVGDNSNIEIIATPDPNTTDPNPETSITNKAKNHNFYSTVADPTTDLTPTYVTVGGHVAVRNSLTASLQQGMGIKGDGEQISNVSLSSIWQRDLDDPDTLILSEDIDGNTGLMKCELSSFKSDIQRLLKKNKEDIGENELQITFSLTDNSRLFDAYLEIQRNISDPSSINDTLEPIVYNSETNTEYNKPVSTIRVSKNEHLIITPKF